jgi:hypothetical protein
MPSLTDNFKVGNVSAPSLIKSAASLQNELATFNDDEAAITYENSAKTADDLSTYLNYLNGRITTLQSSDSVTDQTKALTMSQKIVSATHSNISADITRENIDLMSQGDAGTVAGYQSKLQVLGGEYSRAQAIGDDALAQSLMSQYYSVSQTMQTAQQTAATAASTLGASNASSQNGVATNLEDSLDKLNSDIKAGGMSKLNGTVSDWVKANGSMLTTLGVALPKGAQPSYQDIVMGITQAEINAHTLAATAESPYDPATAQGYYEDAQKLAEGQTTVSTLAGSLTAEQIQNWTQNPQMFAPKEEIVDGQLQFTYTSPSGQSGASGISGYKYQNGQVVANYTGSDISPDITTKQISALNQDLQKMGLSFSKATTSTSLANGVAVQFNNQTKNFLKNLTGGQTGIGTKLYLQPNGNYQLATIDQNGTGHIYEITKDAKGLYGAYEQQANGQYTAAGGQYGFNENTNGIVNTKSDSKTAVGQKLGAPGNNTNAFAYGTQNPIGNTARLQSLISQAQSVKAQAQLPVPGSPNYVPAVVPSPPVTVGAQPTPSVGVAKTFTAPTIQTTAAGSSVVQPAKGAAAVSPGGAPQGGRAVSGGSGSVSVL